MAHQLATEGKGYDHLFGRRWKVSVLVPVSEGVKDKYMAHVLSDSDFEDKALRVTFRIQKYGWTNPNFSEVSVYNVRPDMENLLIKSGHRVRVEAGYVNGNYGVIYEAPIFQPLWEREEAVTSKMTFRCVDAMDVIWQNHVETVGTALDHQKNMVLQMAQRSRVAFNPEIGDSIKSNKLRRPKVFFDDPMLYLRRWAQQNGTLPSVLDEKITLDKLQTAVSSELKERALVVSPGKGGLIGTPTQTQDGVDFTLLLNPLITIFDPPMLIKLDNSRIRQMALQYNTEGFSRLDEDWMYRVIGLTHEGDTRGLRWYTHVVGVNQSMEGLRAAMFMTEQDVQG